MKASSDALYSNLLLDLYPVLSEYQIRHVESGGSDWPDITSSQAAAASILRSLLKKFQGSVSKDADAKALDKFLKCNVACGEWVLQLGNSAEEELYGEFKKSVYNFYFLDSDSSILDHDHRALERGRTGPGVSIQANGNDFYTKLFSSRLSCTSPYLYEQYKRYISAYPAWDRAEVFRSETYGKASIVAGSRLSFVPKNDAISRCICIEPSLNMFYQLGFGSILERRLISVFGLNMADQQFKNRRLACRGSIMDSSVTIDLASASDTISMKMLEAVLPPPFLATLKRFRSKSVEVGSASHELHMVSTMGNGFTFPLQTMLFACIVQAAARVMGQKLIYPRGAEVGNFGVFGDDIICPSSIVRQVMTLLRILGFSTNLDKTFVEGPFRESCGQDYFRGLDIRGVYVKTLDSMTSRFAVINQLNLFSAKTGISLPNCVRYLLNTVKRNYIPRWENDDAGVKVPLWAVDNKRYCSDTGSILYFPYRPRPLYLRITETAIITPRSFKPRIYNPDGLFISFLQRSINACKIGTRLGTVRYKRELGVAPFWDAEPTGRLFEGRFKWQRWDTAVYYNHYG